MRDEVLESGELGRVQRATEQVTIAGQIGRYRLAFVLLALSC